jgi:hypothetical protein
MGVVLFIVIPEWESIIHKVVDIRYSETGG